MLVRFIGRICLLIIPFFCTDDGLVHGRERLNEMRCVMCHGVHDKVDKGGRMMPTKVIIEIRVSQKLSAEAVMSLVSEEVVVEGFHLDREYEPVSVPATDGMQAELQAAGEEIFVIRGTIDGASVESLKSIPRVVGVYTDGRVEAIER